MLPFKSAMMINRITQFIILALLTSCSLDIPLEDQVSGDDAIDTPEAAREALNAAYNSLNFDPVNFSLLADDFMPTYLISRDQSTKKFYNWDAIELARFADNLWSDHYHTIAQINTVLESKQYMILDNEQDVAKWEKVEGEAYALKAMIYQELLDLFADNVADKGIILKDKVELEFLKRSSIAACEEKILDLLTKAKKLLKSKEINKNYLSYDACLVLQARYLLTHEKFSDVITTLEEITKNRGYDGGKDSKNYQSLWTDKDSEEKVFTKSNDFLFPLTKLIDTPTNGDYVVVSSSVNFEEGDIRNDITIIPFLMKKNGSDKLIRSLIGKYRSSVNDYEPKDINCIRLAEVYFIMAESYARLNNVAKGVAIMNVLLENRGAQLLDSNMKSQQLLSKIIEEKQKEFVGEGIRFYDIKRWGMSLDRYNVDSKNISRTIQSNDFRWVLPIPISEIKQNKEIKQNPGWESVLGNY
ncbi:RagB/SusD family nutrient uptake outer membrane protein [Puteibacter caeruleilacunae]|nr:RagB/SusD family nutrient uptake outer membrane protein [Puteibacter caeruleilacunae]